MIPSVKDSRVNLLDSIQKLDQHRAGLGPHQDAGLASSRPGLPIVADELLQSRACNPIEWALPSFSVGDVPPGH